MLSSASRNLQELQLFQESVFFHGRTMEPFLRDGDYVDVEPLRGAESRLGDILVFWENGRLVCRRLLAKDGFRLRVNGDNRPPRRESWLAPEEVVGKLIRRFRGNSVLEANHWQWRLGSVAAILMARSRSLRFWLKRSLRRRFRRLWRKLSR